VPFLEGTSVHSGDRLCEINYFIFDGENLNLFLIYRNLSWAPIDKALWWIGYMLNNLGIFVRFSTGTRGFSLLQSANIGSGNHPASYSMGTPGIKRLGCEADHLPLSSADVKNEWTYTFIPLYSPKSYTRTTLQLQIQTICIFLSAGTRPPVRTESGLIAFSFTCIISEVT
jgi:hypothetical protein